MKLGSTLSLNAFTPAKPSCDRDIWTIEADSCFICCSRSSPSLESRSRLTDANASVGPRASWIDQSPSHRLICRQHAVQKEQLLRPAVTDRAGHEPSRAPVGGEPDLRVGAGEFCLLGSDSEIGARHEAEAGASYHAVYSGGESPACARTRRSLPSSIRLSTRSGSDAKPATSPPAQNARSPAPVSSTHRTADSALNCLAARASSFAISTSIAFSCTGRLIVMRATPFSMPKMRVSQVMAFPLLTIS